MDYVEGTSLAALVRESPLPARQAAAYVQTIAEAMHYAHQKGILHRDHQNHLSSLISHPSSPRFPTSEWPSGSRAAQS
ncbi:MAG: hypothetical protein HY000_37795 [Planctomycetes bacterium]|nr:hypothetical protein [Planctomycetota bacterium]